MSEHVATSFVFAEDGGSMKVYLSMELNGLDKAREVMRNLSAKLDMHVILSREDDFRRWCLTPAQDMTHNPIKMGTLVDAHLVSRVVNQGGLMGSTTAQIFFRHYWRSELRSTEPTMSNTEIELSIWKMWHDQSVVQRRAWEYIAIDAMRIGQENKAIEDSTQA